MSRTPILNNYFDKRETIDELLAVVKAIMLSKKGVLGLDELSAGFDYPFSRIGLENTWENRRLYRTFLAEAPLQEQFSAALLSEEFITQSTVDSIEFKDILSGNGLTLGVRLDKGMCPLYGTKGEFRGAGMDGITKLLTNYKDSGCKFSKWRTVYQISENSPTLHGVNFNCRSLSFFAATSQNIGLVPIVSIEILPDGSEGVDKAKRVLEKILVILMKMLRDCYVLLEATILQVSFVQNGYANDLKVSSPEEVALNTLEAFKKSLPTALGGILFHSSGLSEEMATQTLNIIMQEKILNESLIPWNMTYSFGRAQQASGSFSWNGSSENQEEGHKEIMSRAIANNQALLGEYVAESVVGSFSNKPLFISNYID